MRVLLAMLLLTAALAGCSGSDTPTTSQAPVTVTQTKVQTVTQTVIDTPSETATSTSAPITTTSSSSTSTSTETTPPGVQPTVENVTRGTLTDTTVVIGWNVTGGPDVRSKVEYGPSGFTLATALQNGTGTKSATITALKSCTDYTSRVVALGGGYTVESGALNFRTLGAAPTISAPVVSNVLHDRFTVSWTVTGPGDSVSLVEYGGTLAYGSATAGLVGPGAHSIVISGLTKNTDYHLRVKVTAGCGSVTGSDVVQKTADLAHIDMGAPGPFAFNPNPVLVDNLKLYVFEIKNTDTVARNWSIRGQSYSTTGLIAPGATYVFPTSIQLASGTYTMESTSPTSMTGTINSS